MNNNKLESQFLDYIDGRLSAAAKERFEAMLNSDSILKAEFQNYQAILRGENAIHQESFTPSSNFDVKVMERISEAESNLIKRLFMTLTDRRLVLGSLATVATLVLVLKTAQQTEQQLPLALPQPPVAEESRTVGTADSRPVTPIDNIKDKKENLIGKLEPLPAHNLPAEVGSGPTVQMDDRVLKQDGSNGQAYDMAGAPQKSFARAEQQVAKERKLSEEVDIFGNTQAIPPAPTPRTWVANTMPDYMQPPVVVENREAYRSYGENPRIDVRADAVSTFSIDVDTGSYTNARRYLRGGSLPPADSVRVEEFINYFDYNYPVQHEKPFSLAYEIAPSPLEPDRLLLKLGVKARDAVQEEKPWNLVFLVDVSGSMESEDKLGLVKKSLRLLTQKMREKDKISIVTYAGNAGLVLDATGKADEGKILAAIENLTAGGSTAGSSGIELAYSVADKARIQDGVNRVILATDGDFNVGVTSHEALIKLIEEKRKSGVTLTTLGFGTGNIQEGMMEQLANKGNGNYFYVDSFDEARKVFETDLMGTIEVVAKDVKLQIEFNPANVSHYRLIGYENRKLEKEDFNNDKIDAGEIGSGHTVTAIYEVVLKDSALAKTFSVDSRYQTAATEKKADISGENLGELGFLKVRFKAPNADTSELLTFPIEKSKVEATAAESSDDFRFAAAVAYFGQILRDSKYVGTYSLTDVLDLASKSLGKDSHGYRREFVELVKNARAVKGGK